MKSNKKIIGSMVILAVFFIFLIVGYMNSRPVKIDESSKDIFKEETAAKTSKEVQENNYAGEITVYVNGQVKNPGVYRLKDSSRVESLIKAAGGFTGEADSCRLNLAKKLKDEDYIYVDSKTSNISGGGTSSSVSSQSQTDSGDKIDINRASKEELKTVPGIGDITAQKIIDYREQNGDFTSVEDLKKIDRIGDKTLDKMRDKIEVR